MGKVLRLRPPVRRDAPRTGRKPPRTTARGMAEILLFTGVRREYLEDHPLRRGMHGVGKTSDGRKC